MERLDDDTSRLGRALDWLDATPAELVGLAVLLLGVLATTVVLTWSALGRPGLPDAPSAPSDPAGAAGEVGASVDGVGEHGHATGEDGRPVGADVPAPDGGPDASPSEVTVHVAGAVASPGLVTLPAGARIGDALDAAGGPSDDADLARINLARALLDGEHVRVLRIGEEDPGPPPGGEAGGPNTGAAGGAAPGGGDGGVVDVNRAGVEELTSLPGIGPALAARIVEHREQHGPFRTPGDLRDVRGIGEATFQGLADRVTVG